MENTDIQVVTAQPQNAMMTLKNVTDRVNLVHEALKKVMVNDTHYGKVPGCGEKMVLLKPGADLLAMMFRLTPSFTVTKTAMEGGHREYEVVCTMTGPDGTVLGQGVGSGCTMEKKYRYRTEWHGKEKRMVENPDIADVYNCVTPDTRVLTQDLQWVPAGEIQSGDMLIGVEENMTSEYARHFTTGEATVHGLRMDAIYEIALEDGRTVRCNGEHKWLVKKVGLKGTEWVPTADIYKEISERKGRPRSWTVMSVCAPWSEDKSKEAGYLAGLLDADGSLAMAQLIVLFAQQENTVLARMQAGLTERGYQFGIGSCKTEHALEKCVSHKQVYSLRVRGGLTEQIRLLGTIRPPRLLERWIAFMAQANRRLEGRGSGTGRPVKIISVKSIGKGEVVSLGTSCRTYIAEGLVCHNTVLKMAKKRAHVDATLTVTGAADLFTQDLIENEDGDEKSARPPVAMPSAKPAPANTDAPVEGEILEGIVEDVAVKSGEKNGKPWTRYGIKIGKEFYNTFSDTIGNTAQECRGTTVKLTWKANGNFKDAVAIDPILDANDKAVDAVM